jgi:hypothetical protein
VSPAAPAHSHARCCCVSRGIWPSGDSDTHQHRKRQAATGASGSLDVRSVAGLSPDEVGVCRSDDTSSIPNVWKYVRHRSTP